MHEDEGTPATNQELARAAMMGIGKMMVIKWSLIWGVSYVLKRAAKKAAS